MKKLIAPRQALLPKKLGLPFDPEEIIGSKARAKRRRRRVVILKG